MTQRESNSGASVRIVGIRALGLPAGAGNVPSGTRIRTGWSHRVNRDGLPLQRVRRSVAGDSREAWDSFIPCWKRLPSEKILDEVLAMGEAQRGTVARVPRP